MEKSDKTDEKREKREEQITRDEKIKESGQVELFRNSEEHKLYLLSIIGEIEGHECLASTTKTTKYTTAQNSFKVIFAAVKNLIRLFL